MTKKKGPVPAKAERKHCSLKFKQQSVLGVVKDGVLVAARDLGLVPAELYAWRTKAQQQGHDAEALQLQQSGVAWLKRRLVRLKVLLLQIPLICSAWREQRHGLPYCARMATQLSHLALDPARTQGCLPELVARQWRLERRRAALLLLSTHRLNVFSSTVQTRHAFLPRLGHPAPSAASAAGVTP